MAKGELKIKIGKELLTQRMLLGYSQEYVANTLGMSQNSYSKIERNITDVSLNRVYEIADILEISVYKLLPPSKYANPLDLRSVLGWLRGIWIRLLLFFYGMRTRVPAEKARATSSLTMPLENPDQETRPDQG